MFLCVRKSFLMFKIVLACIAFLASIIALLGISQNGASIGVRSGVKGVGVRSGVSGAATDVSGVWTKRRGLGLFASSPKVTMRGK
jgi:hypothetical protein